MFSNLSSSSISLATVTPSLVMRGAPNDLSSRTLRPLGPSVTRTAWVSVSMPCNILSRASTENFTSLADISVFLFVRPHLGEQLLGEPQRGGLSIRCSRPSRGPLHGLLQDENLGERTQAAFFLASASTRTPIMSLSFMMRYSTSSILTSVPDHLQNRMRSPTLTSIGMSLPASSRPPGPTAMTLPCC